MGWRGTLWRGTSSREEEEVGGRKVGRRRSGKKFVVGVLVFFSGRHELSEALSVCGSWTFEDCLLRSVLVDFFQRAFLSRGMAKGSPGKGMSNGMEKDLVELRSGHVRLGYTPGFCAHEREERNSRRLHLNLVSVSSPLFRERSVEVSARLLEMLSSSRRA
jgi:hypothetical protein